MSAEVVRRRSPIPDIPVPPECREMIRRNALFALSHSGGKDSQAMTILLARIVPLIFAPVASGKTLLDRIEERGRFPSASVRWCTSDFKRSPIERELRRHLKAHPRFNGRVVNCMGHRADESPTRAGRDAWTRNARNSRAGREWVDWLPVHALSAADVFRVIRDAGQSPHWAYAAGMRRLSCSFCILASRQDLRIAARLRPALYRRYAVLEQRIGHTLSPSRIPLPELTGVPAEAGQAPFEGVPHVHGYVRDRARGPVPDGT